ncbi:MAG: hypothetical protein ACRCWI_05900, partial [Brevinema sp.]
PVSNTDDDLHQLETPPKGDYIEEDIEENCLGELTYKELRKYFENPEKLCELSEGARNHIIDMAKQVHNEMGDSFEKIVITSVFRSKEKQRDEVLLKKLVLTEDPSKSNMYEYYKNRAPKSAPYLKIMQNLYDGVYMEVPEDNYLAIESIFVGNPEYGKKIRNIFEGIIDKNGIRKGNVEDVKSVLTISYIEKQLFNPSFHTITDSLGKPASQAIDLRTSSTSELLLVLLEKYKTATFYNGGADGEPHYHITFKVDKIK